MVVVVAVAVTSDSCKHYLAVTPSCGLRAGAEASDSSSAVTRRHNSEKAVENALTLKWVCSPIKCNTWSIDK